MLSLSSCSSVYYLYQASMGQLRLLNRARPIHEVIEDPKTDPDLSELLKKIPQIKAYGEKAGLKATSNYREYVKLDEDAVVYVVTVSDALAFKPKIFSFPIVGSFNYIGWFKKEDARQFANGFEKEGYDVDLRGASAYSTLGWFRDPLLSTMIPKEEHHIAPEAYPELVNVFLHESVHATLYISNQSTFNEGLAVFIADVLTERFFRDEKLLESPGFKKYVEDNARYKITQKRLTQAYQDLKAIYDSNDSPDEKLKKKAAYITALETELHFRRKITNAMLIQFQTYHSSQDDFKRLFQKTNEDIPAFLKLLSTLKDHGFSEKQMDELGPVLRALESSI